MAHFGTPMKVHPQWFSILYAFRDLRRILLKRPDLRIRFLSLLTKRIQSTNPLSGPGPTRTLLMHLTKCGWTKAPTRNTLIVAHNELGTMEFFIAPRAQLERWLSYTASQYLLNNLRARAEGETNGYARKDARGIPVNFVADLSVNRHLLDDNVGGKLAKATPHLGEEPLSSVSKRRLEVIMTGAIRTQVRLNSAGIKTPAGAINERVCPHCMQAQEETTEHILWECTAGADLRLLTKVYLDQVLLDSPARAGIPTDWAEWPPALRAF